jgi:hypothetical protein
MFRSVRTGLSVFSTIRIYGLKGGKKEKAKLGNRFAAGLQVQVV